MNTRLLLPAQSNGASGGSSSSAGSSTRELAGMLRAMEFLAAEGWPTIEAQSVRALLEVALNPDVTMTELIKRLNISGAAVSRNIDFLGDGKIGTPGAKWVEVNVDPHDRRMKRVRLTAKGRSVMNKLAEELRSYR